MTAMSRTVRATLPHGVDAAPPPGRSSYTHDEPGTPAIVIPGPGSADLIHIVYLNDAGERSERSVTCHRVTQLADGALLISGFCHVRKMPRAFRSDRIVDMADPVTGELVDAREVLDEIVRRINGRMDDLMHVLLFMSHCDGVVHPSERRAIEDAIVGHAIRNDDGDAEVEAAMRRLDRIAPRGNDFLKSLKALTRHTDGARMARFVLDHTRRVVEADGKITDEEFQWGLEIDNYLKAVAMR